VTVASGSIAFDRAARNYERTRALSPRAMDETLALLRGELEARGPCLEIGVGTGRMALPLAEAGISVAGVDLSERMLRRLVEKAPGRPPVPVAVADATRLPFDGATFGAALFCHVLHLIPDWRRALGEALRVLRPGGVVLVDVGGWGSGWGAAIVQRFCREAGVAHEFVGVRSAPEVDRAMSEAGVGLRVLPSIRERTIDSVEARIRRLESGVFSFTWPLSPRERRRAGRAVRLWARDRFGDLHRKRRAGRTITWRAFDVL
jgi:SAM-dependent methyltransferase